jgi:Holliday junction resolvasome RuvABC endonuclease subunit
MFQIPPTHYVVLAIDPGTETMGVAALGVDLVDFNVFAYAVTTLHASHSYNPLGVESSTYGDRFARLNTLSRSVASFCETFRPHSVIAESPFLGRFPQSYEALVDCLSVLRRTVSGYDPALVLETVDPPSAKKAVGINPKGATKDDVKNAVLRLPIHRYPGVHLERIEEHASDAIAVGWFRIQQVIQQVRQNATR